MRDLEHRDVELVARADEPIRHHRMHDTRVEHDSRDRYCGKPFDVGVPGARVLEVHCDACEGYQFIALEVGTWVDQLGGSDGRDRPSEADPTAGRP